LAGAADRAIDERRAAVRTVRDAISEAMTHAERDRMHGVLGDRDGAIAAANRASAVVREVDDEEARRLVASWKALFDAIPKAWKDAGVRGTHFRDTAPGYPEDAWNELRAAAHTALEQLGVVLRRMLGTK
jgi:hypothetical protein